MSPRLLPYTSVRHVAPGLAIGLAAVTAWCVSLVTVQSLGARSGPWLSDPDPQAAIVLGAVAAAVAGGLVLVEGRLERTPIALRLVEAIVASVLAGATALLGVLLLDGGAADRLADDTLAWRARAGAWSLVGLAATSGPLTTRLTRRLLEWAQVRWSLRALPSPPEPRAGVRVVVAAHLVGGLAAGLVGSVVAYVVGLEAALDDRHLGFALGCGSVGFLAGGLVEPVPVRAWRGWIRVLRGARPGWRIALDPGDPSRAERFVGHFPSGVDLYLPAADGVAELHASILARPDGTFAIRGLTARPVEVRRLLERVDLSWSPDRAAPLETPLVDGDRVDLGRATIELVVLPREGSGP